MMDLRLPPTTMPLGIRPATLARPGADKPVAGVEGGFSGAMKSALHEVSSAQNNAAQMQRGVQMESPTVSLEDTMIAIQKAQIGFQATLHVRNRMVQAYTDIMNMQV
jgi:flagellar hook-basal body complex protein FliE